MDERTNRQEIESHSSNLTNQRIDGIIQVINANAYEAMSANPPSVQHALAYNSAVMVLYLATSSSYSIQKEVDKKEDGFKKGIEEHMKRARYYNIRIKYSECKQKDVEIMIDNSTQLYHLMHTALQNLKYFFRFGELNVRGIKETLKMFELSGKNKEVNNDEISGHSGKLQNKVTEKSNPYAPLNKQLREDNKGTN